MIFISLIRLIHGVISYIHNVNLPYCIDELYLCNSLIDAGYIDAAQKKFGKRGTFVCKPVRKDTLDKNSRFDLILAKGVLHHLNDIEAADIFELAQTHLNTGGRMITFDGCYVHDQSYFTKKFLAMDRGKYVRTKEAYMNLANNSFLNVIPIIRHDLLRIPYTILIMECSQ